MKERIIQLVVLLCLQMFACSCKKNGCPLSSGALTTETRNVLPFNEIILYDKINLLITQDSARQLSVEAGKNLLPGILTDVENNVLTIKNINKCNAFINPGEQINVYVSGNQLQKIGYYGAGDITSTNMLRASIFTIDSWFGTGSVKLKLEADQANAIVRNNNADITISGRSDSTYIYCGQVGSANMIDFISTHVAIDSKSIKDIYVNVTGSLHANIVYKGNVYYKGNPATIDTLITNSGRLIHL